MSDVRQRPRAPENAGRVHGSRNHEATRTSAVPGFGAAVAACTIVLAGCATPPPAVSPGAVADPEATAPPVQTYEVLGFPVEFARNDSLETAAADSGAVWMATPDSASPFAGLELLFPEILELDDAYRRTLEAIWGDDLPTAEAGIAFMDSALAERNDTENPLATIFFQNFGERMERLKDLLEDARTFQSYVAQVDSLGVITQEGDIDSTALTALLETPAIGQVVDPRHDFELVENPLTDRWVRYFTGDGRQYMERWLQRKPLYEKIIYKILDEYKLPHDMIYLAMIESGLNLKARSYANAVGPWQFISSTGRLYGLKIDWWVDERRHLEKATRAAASHLSDLYESLGSWPLALAAYNCGIRRVERAIRRHGTRDFWRLSSLPRQTRNYVPKFMAALHVGKHAKEYGFDIPKVDGLTYDVVRVDDATDLSLIAELSSTPLDSILDLNPHLKRWATPPGETYEVKVPAGKGEATLAKLAEVPKNDRVTWRRHRVRRGESLSKIARRYGTSVRAVKQANRLRRNTIRAGSFLLIPVVSGSSSRAERSIAAAAKTTAGTTYRVRRGDTLSRIAKRHGVTVRQIMRWNELHSSRIHVGDRLILHGPGDEGVRKRVTYVVRRGDTLSKIGKRHRVSVRQIMRWNKKRNTRIRVGERLRLYVKG